MNITRAILHVVPDAIFSVKEEDYDTIIWCKENKKPKPSLQELEAAWDNIKNTKVEAKNEVDELKAKIAELEKRLDILDKKP